MKYVNKIINYKDFVEYFGHINSEKLNNPR
jgi:hypothetical protein